MYNNFLIFKKNNHKLFYILFFPFGKQRQRTNPDTTYRMAFVCVLPQQNFRKVARKFWRRRSKKAALPPGKTIS